MSYRKLSLFYDRLMADIPYWQWLDFLAACWERYGKPRTLVDLGCGTGNLAIPLADAGYHVYGIDQSEEMLTLAQEKWENKRNPSSGTLQLLNQDMRQWQSSGKVDAVISCCDCLNYLTEEEDVQAVFQRTYESLSSEGLFIFDVLTSIRLQKYAQEQPFIWDDPDLAYIWTCDYEKKRREICHKLSFFVSQSKRSALHSESLYYRFEECHMQRAYSVDWLVSQLQRTGFKVLVQNVDFSWHHPDENPERLFFVARK